MRVLGKLVSFLGWYLCAFLSLGPGIVHAQGMDIGPNADEVSPKSCVYALSNYKTTFVKAGFLTRLMFQIYGQVSVENLSTGQVLRYNWTNRGLYQLTEDLFYPPEITSPRRFIGKKFIDLGTGGGRLVKEYRKAGVEAYGVDIYLPPELDNIDHFRRAHVANTSFESNFFDFAMMNFSVISYNSVIGEAHQADLNLVNATFTEAHRILKPGGKFLISPFPQGTYVNTPTGLTVYDSNSQVIAEIAGFKTSRIPDQGWRFTKNSMGRGFAHNWIELEKF